MKISTVAAIKRFFPNPSLKMVYAEAFANAIDAGATEITIKVDIKSYANPETLRIAIRDNGIGFTDENFGRFSELMKKSDKRHKGLGRLVFLAYFKEIKVDSVFGGTKKRAFVFTGDEAPVETSDLEVQEASYAQLVFSGFLKDRISEYGDISASGIKNTILEQFTPQLLVLREENKELALTIEVNTETPEPRHEFYSEKIVVTLNDLPEFESASVAGALPDLFNEDFRVLYRFEEHSTQPSSFFLCVDGRALKISLTDSFRMPTGVSARFLMVSSFFDSKTDDSRQGIDLEPNDMASVKKGFLGAVGSILVQKYPEISARNIEARKKLADRYPHLLGFFPESDIGLLDESATLAEAQAKYFSAQKEILNADSLTDEQYDQSLTLASRVLSEYILYREKIIGKLESITKEHPEETIHNLIAPRFNEFRSESFCEDIYRSNAWLLDDKYMGYQCVLSEQNLGRLIAEISTDEEQENEAYRPDIALVFNEDIEKADHPVDVVVVELKKKGIRYKDNLVVLEQLLERARRLVNYYPKKIQRMWFFGIVEFDKKLRTKMKEQKWIRLYSTDDVYSHEEPVIPTDRDDNELSETPIPVQVTLLSFQALWKDAKLRNATFMKILREGIKKSNEAKNASVATS